MQSFRDTVILLCLSMRKTFKYIITVYLPFNNFKCLWRLFLTTQRTVWIKKVCLHFKLFPIISIPSAYYSISMQSWKYSTAVCCKSHQGNTKRYNKQHLTHSHSLSCGTWHLTFPVNSQTCNQFSCRGCESEFHLFLCPLPCFHSGDRALQSPMDN